jgi:O-antigen/teichoic acid export membrane protein
MKSIPMKFLSKENLRSIGVITGGRVLGNLCEFVALALGARTLGPSDYGKFSYVLAVSVVSSQLFDLGLARILTIRSSLWIGARAQPAATGRVYGSLLGIRLVVAAILLPFLALMALLGQWGFFAAGLALGFLASTVLCQSAIFQSQLDFSKLALSSYLPGSLRVVGIACLMASGHASLRSLIILYLGAHSAAVLMLLQAIPWRTVDLGSLVKPFRELIHLAHFGKWLIVAAIFEVLYLKTDVFSLRLLSSSHDLGIYAAAFTFAGLLNLMFNSVVAYYVPLMCRAAGEGRKDRLKHYFLESTDLLALVGIPAATGIWAVGPVLFPLVFGEQYRESSLVWSILVIFAICWVVNQTGAVFFALERLDIITMVTAGIFASNVVFCWLLVPPYGARGAAWAVSIGMILSLVACWGATYRLLGTIPNILHIGNYLGCSLVFVPIVRAISLPVPKFNLLAKILAGIIVYTFLVWLTRKERSQLSGEAA